MDANMVSPREATPLAPSRADRQAASETIAIGNFGAAIWSTESRQPSVSARRRTRVGRTAPGCPSEWASCCHQNVPVNAAPNMVRNWARSCT